MLQNCKLVSTLKRDPELSSNMSDAGQERRTQLIERGLSQHYVTLCFRAYHDSIISTGRLAEMLLVTETELPDVAGLYGVAVPHVS